MRSLKTLAVAAILLLPVASLAHDTWVQTNTAVVRVGDVVHVDLMLGDHGNQHRDFKLASKVEPGPSTLEVIAPDGKKYDLKERLVDTGYAPQEGFWSGRFIAAQPGLYLVSHTYDKVVSYAPKRAIKSSKTFFVASRSLDKVSEANPGFDRKLGHPLELIPEANPVTPMGPGQPIKVRLLFEGKPLADVKVSFIPRGETLSEGTDATYERTTDAAGRAQFTPKFGNYYLVAAHHSEPKRNGPNYDTTEFSATMAVYVPQVCPCCGE
jgi:uncharacterized GH25 family protein